MLTMKSFCSSACKDIAALLPRGSNVSGKFALDRKFLFSPFWCVVVAYSAIASRNSRRNAICSYPSVRTSPIIIDTITASSNQTKQQPDEEASKNPSKLHHNTSVLLLCYFLCYCLWTCVSTSVHVFQPFDRVTELTRIVLFCIFHWIAWSPPMIQSSLKSKVK